ncbi:MAG: hypothetical protein B7Y41_04305 [Hydrogenophilales bacterium 28-61-23]|nr:MAG: hypothetical protein B7Y41_04305 [Hydrogenophilales bacterium 28-61-23]
MKVEMIPQKTDNVSSQDASPDFVMIKVSGHFDPKSDMLQKARKLLEEIGATDRVKSFDAALDNDALFNKVVNSK